MSLATWNYIREIISVVTSHCYFKSDYFTSVHYLISIIGILCARNAPRYFSQKAKHPHGYNWKLLLVEEIHELCGKKDQSRHFPGNASNDDGRPRLATDGTLLLASLMVRGSSSFFLAKISRHIHFCPHSFSRRMRVHHAECDTFLFFSLPSLFPSFSSFCSKTCCRNHRREIRRFLGNPISGIWRAIERSWRGHTLFINSRAGCFSNFGNSQIPSK